MSTTRHRRLALVAAALFGAALAGPGVIAGAEGPPSLVRYQGRLSDDAGVPLTGSHTFDFRIFDVPSGGTALWSEGPRSLALASGVLDVLLGEVTPLPPSVFPNRDTWLEVTVDGAVLLPRQRLSSVPYAHGAGLLDGSTRDQLRNRAFHFNTQTPATISPQGTGSGLDADRVDGLETGNLAGQLAVNNGTVNEGLNADQVDGQHASQLLDRANHTGTQAPATISPQGVGSGLNADSLDGMTSNQFVDTSATAQVKSGNLSVADLTASGNDINFGSAGANISADPTLFSVTAGDGETDQLFLIGGNSSDDGHLAIFGDGAFTMRSGNGLFQFLTTTGVATAALDSVGNLQIDGDLDVDGNDVTFAGGSSITSSTTQFLVTAGDANTDDIEIVAGNSSDDGRLLISGDNSMELRSGNGVVSFFNGNNGVLLAQLDPFGQLFVGSAASVGTANTLCSQGASSGSIGRCSSSRRHKEAIADLAMDGLATVERLRPVEFSWTQSGEHDLGFVAEEVAEVDPLLAFYDENGEVISVKYGQLTAVLVKALQEQQRTFAEYRAAHETEMNDLRRQIEALDRHSRAREEE